MKRSAGKMFIKYFIRSLIVVTVLSVTGILSYKAAMMFWQPKEKNTAISEQDKIKTYKNISSNKGVSKNLIYCYDKDSNEITKMVLEILNSNDKKLTYITIPVSTEFTMSNALYSHMILDDPEIPQVLKLSTLTGYLDADKAFEDEVKLAEELLETDINYYTAIPKDTYDTMFTEKNINQKDGYDAVPEEIFTNDYKKQMQTMDSKEKLKSYLEEVYPTFRSDLSLKDKKKLLNGYYEALQSDITFDLIKGTNLNNGYIINEDIVPQQLSDYITGSDKK